MKAAWDFIKASMLSSNLLNFFFIGELWEEEDGAWLGKFGGGLGWRKLLEKLGREDCSGLKRNLGDSSNRDCMFVSMDYAAAVSRPCSGIPVALAEYEK